MIADCGAAGASDADRSQIGTPFVPPTQEQLLEEAWKFMPPDTPAGGCLWTKAGCSANAAFKATKPRFAKPCHDLTPVTNTREYRHLGPGMAPTVSHEGFDPRLQDTTMLALTPTDRPSNTD